jgi:hypothetical protein
MTHFRTRLLALCCAILMLTAACTSGTETATTELPTLADTSAEATAETDADDDAGDAGAAGDGEATDEEGEDAEPEEVDPEIAMAEYEKCMADQGVDVSMAVAGEEGSSIETFETDPNDIDANAGAELDFEDFEAAAEICETILEDAFGSFEATPEQEAEFADQMLELEKCMSEAGFDIDMSGNSFQLDESIDFQAFEEAMSSCGNGIETIGADQ